MDESEVILLVGVNCVDPARETEFNDWYENVHLPEVCRAPGVKGADRYQIAAPAPDSPQYLAMYQLDGQQGLQDYTAYRQAQSQGKVPPFTAGPPLKVVWRTAYRRLRLKTA
jgi:hypothetical protein